jgi:hypothetical protein
MKNEKKGAHFVTLYVKWSFIVNFGTFCFGINWFIPCTLMEFVTQKHDCQQPIMFINYFQYLF